MSTVFFKEIYTDCLGLEEIEQDDSDSDVEWVGFEDVDERPVAAFVFHLRTESEYQILYKAIVDPFKGDLKLIGIIPRSPRPVPLEMCPADDLSTNELREAVRRLQVCLHSIYQRHG